MQTVFACVRLNFFNGLWPNMAVTGGWAFFRWLRAPICFVLPLSIFWEKMRTDFNRCNITLVCVVINCLNLTKMFATGKIGLKLFQPVLTWQKRFETAFTSLKRNAMTIFVFWNWRNIKACSLYEDRLLTLVCVIPGIQNLKSEGETESGIPLPWSGIITIVHMHLCISVKVIMV